MNIPRGLPLGYFFILELKSEKFKKRAAPKDSSKI